MERHDFPTITISPDILRLLPHDSELANTMVNEILSAVLKDEPLGDDDVLANRPDWQRDGGIGRQQRAEGKVISHQEVLRWHNGQHR